MAASRVLPRLCSRLPSLAIKPNKPSTFPGVSLFKSNSLPQVSSSSVLRPSLSPISRLPVELSCLMSMMPLHSTTASARLTSLLPIQSQNWGLVPQATYMQSLSLLLDSWKGIKQNRTQVPVHLSGGHRSGGLNNLRSAGV